MIKLKDYQKRAVKKLKENIIDMLSLQGDRQKIVFKAPTGAGKTVMASALLDELNMEILKNQSVMSQDEIDSLIDKLISIKDE